MPRLLLCLCLQRKILILCSSQTFLGNGSGPPSLDLDETLEDLALGSVVDDSANEGLSLSYGYDARLAAEEKGNKGDRLMNVLRLAELGKIEQLNMATLSKSDLPHEFRENSQLLINCLEMTEFALRGVSRSDVDILYNYTPASPKGPKVNDAASCLETLCADKLFECEERNARDHPRLKKTFVALGTHIRKYKSDIHDLKAAASKSHLEPLISIEEYKELQPSARPDIHSAYDSFPRKKKQKTTP
jgi:hypothetical protein